MVWVRTGHQDCAVDEHPHVLLGRPADHLRDAAEVQRQVFENWPAPWIRPASISFRLVRRLVGASPESNKLPSVGDSLCIPLEKPVGSSPRLVTVLLAVLPRLRLEGRPPHCEADDVEAKRADLGEVVAGEERWPIWELWSRSAKHDFAHREIAEARDCTKSQRSLKTVRTQTYKLDSRALTLISALRRSFPHHDRPTNGRTDRKLVELRGAPRSSAGRPRSSAEVFPKCSFVEVFRGPPRSSAEVLQKSYFEGALLGDLHGGAFSK
eukprot:gene17527-biopygen847